MKLWDHLSLVPPEGWSEHSACACPPGLRWDQPGFLSPSAGDSPSPAAADMLVWWWRNSIPHINEPEEKENKQFKAFASQQKFTSTHLQEDQN